MEKYITDPKVKKYLIKSAYKETTYWKSGKKKRTFAYLCLLSPIPIYFVALAVELLQGIDLTMAILRSFDLPLVVMIITGSIGTISLKSQYSGAKLVPEDRKNDEVILAEKYMLYSYFSLSDGCMHEIRIRYGGINRLQYSEMRKTFYILGEYYTKNILNGKLQEAHRMQNYVDIPMYFNKADSLQQEVSSLCGKEIEIIERL